MPIKAGTVNDFENSMAAAMEAALVAEYEIVKGEPMPAEMGKEDRQMLFAAIAQGVVKYLKENIDAFQITTESFQVTGEPDAPLIESDNPSQINVSGGGSIASHNADVTQHPDSLIKTRGTASVDELATTGTLY